MIERKKIPCYFCGKPVYEMEQLSLTKELSHIRKDRMIITTKQTAIIEGVCLKCRAKHGKNDIEVNA